MGGVESDKLSFIYNMCVYLVRVSNHVFCLFLFVNSIPPGAIAVPDGLWRDGPNVGAFPLRLAAGLWSRAKGHRGPARPSSTRFPRGKIIHFDWGQMKKAALNFYSLNSINSSSIVGGNAEKVVPGLTDDSRRSGTGYPWQGRLRRGFSGTICHNREQTRHGNNWLHKFCLK